MTKNYSNAFNFSSYLNGHVDLRTGQYGSVVHLATLRPQSAPELRRSVALTFSTLNIANNGYGKGWSLNGNSLYDICGSVHRCKD